MNWNLNSLSKNEFERIKLIEAHNSNFNYDIISFCETCLKDSTEIPDPLMDGYTFHPANHPDDTARGGVGLLYKDTLPLTLRHDLAFSESIVAELNFGRKKIFFTVLYRSPANKANTAEFKQFLADFENLHRKINSEKLTPLIIPETLMDIHNFGGIKEKPLLKVKKLKPFSLSSILLK